MKFRIVASLLVVVVLVLLAATSPSDQPAAPTQTVDDSNNLKSFKLP